MYSYSSTNSDRSSGGWFVSHVLLRLFEVDGEVDRCDRLDLSKLQPIDVSVDRLRAAVIALLVRFERRHRAARTGLKPERFHQSGSMTGERRLPGWPGVLRGGKVT